MGKIVAVVNQKGGVGKTTTAVNLTAALKALGKKVLICDFDPQANATSGFGLNKRKLKHSIYDVVVNGIPAKEAIVSTDFGDILPATADLAGAAVELITMPEPHQQLKKALDTVKDQYDLIFIDSPVQCEYYALEGLTDLMNTMRMVKKRINPALEIFGVALTMFDGRTNFSTQVAQEVRRHFPGKVYTTAIPRNVRLAEAPSHGLPVTAYDKHSKGAIAYKAMADEIIKGLGG